MLRPCPACGTAGARWAFRVRGYPHVRCRSCATVFVAPLPPAATTRSTYLADDYHASADDEADRMRHEAQARADVLRAHGCERVLEIGCGPGHFLDACRDVGMHAEGVDPAATADGPAARGHLVHRTWLEDFEPGESFDAVAAWEVVEHLPQPEAALSRMRGWLHNDGLLALSTPSMSGLSARLLGRRFPMLTPPDHLALFSRRGLATLLGRSGFHPVRWSSFSGLEVENLRRGYQRYVTGALPGGDLLARAAARLSHQPLRWADRVGLGTSFEVYARAKL